MASFVLFFLYSEFASTDSYFVELLTYFECRMFFLESRIGSTLHVKKQLLQFQNGGL